MKTMRSVCWAVVPLLVWLACGCERRGPEGIADFTNAAQTAMDIFRNGRLQFILEPGARWTCDADRNDHFIVQNHVTAAVLGTQTVSLTGDVVEIRLTASIYDDRVDWNLHVETTVADSSATYPENEWAGNTPGG